MEDTQAAAGVASVSAKPSSPAQDLPLHFLRVDFSLWPTAGCWVRSYFCTPTPQKNQVDLVEIREGSLAAATVAVPHRRGAAGGRKTARGGGSQTLGETEAPGVPGVHGFHTWPSIRWVSSQATCLPSCAKPTSASAMLTADALTTLGGLGVFLFSSHFLSLW